MSTHRSPTRRHHWSKRRHPDWYHLNKQVSYLPWMYWVDQCCHQVTKDVGELTCRQSDPSSDGQKKNHLPMEGPMLGFSACVYHSRFITPFGFYMWKYLKLHFTVWILHTYLCLRKSTNPKDNQSIFFRIRHFIQRSFSRHECVNSRKERRNSWLWNPTRRFYLRLALTPHFWSCRLTFVVMWGENTSRSNGSMQLSKVSMTCSSRFENSKSSSSARPMRIVVMNLRSNSICRARFWVKLDLCSLTNFSCVDRTPSARLVTSSLSNVLERQQRSRYSLK